MNMLLLLMNEKNSQVRLYTITYTKTLLQAHAHRDHTRLVMDRTNATDHFETLLTKGLNDATPTVKEMCRQAFWIFWEHWRSRGDHSKAIRKSKIILNKSASSGTVMQQHSPSASPKISNSLNRQDSMPISPSNSK
ncbi:clasp N terminal-domain-containing protein [Cokeromyces recurvatus]|uniref:clasp N terminal-domain-containing protein n=1 Tax=Cokeromyces recurvatus TaxID=90255 RepID=UPI00221F4C35|nr:clasp N terminal-domain-containing protein [Cokeromyces recurvatus]KAI7899136.1 clasp N terminal-domain-containing protein [Cokeromyces recurvatus]